MLRITDYVVTKIKGLPSCKRQRTEILLEKTEGYFIAVLQDTSDACHHCICIDGTNKLIFDAAETTSIPLTKINLDMCCGNNGDFYLVSAAARITEKDSKKGACENH